MTAGEGFGGQDVGRGEAGPAARSAAPEPAAEPVGAATAQARLAALEELAGRPLAEHPEGYERLHAEPARRAGRDRRRLTGVRSLIRAEKTVPPGRRTGPARAGPLARARGSADRGRPGRGARRGGAPSRPPASTPTRRCGCGRTRRTPGTHPAAGTSWPARWPRSRRSRCPAGAAWTPAPRPAGSPTCCCAPARLRWSPSTSGTGSWRWRLRTDPRVQVLDRTNVRTLSPADLGGPVAARRSPTCRSSRCPLCCPALTACTAADGDLVPMVKPQFEVGRERLGSGGVVRDPAHRADAVVARRRGGRGSRLAGARRGAQPAARPVRQRGILRVADSWRRARPDRGARSPRPSRRRTEAMDEIGAARRAHRTPPDRHARRPGRRSAGRGRDRGADACDRGRRRATQPGHVSSTPDDGGRRLRARPRPRRRRDVPAGRRARPAGRRADARRQPRPRRVPRRGRAAGPRRDRRRGRRRPRTRSRNASPSTRRSSSTAGSSAGPGR